MQDIIETLRHILPEVFAGPTIDERTGGAIKWVTVQNWRSLRQIPEECFGRLGGGGSPTIVKRDLFLDAVGARRSKAGRFRAQMKPQRRSKASAEAATAVG